MRLLPAVLVAFTLFSGAPRAETFGESQMRAQRDAESRERDAENRARNAGRDSIGKGTRHMHHGRHHHHRPEVNLGAMQIAQGILGLLAAAEASKLAKKDHTNAGNLDQMTGADGSGASAPLAGAAVEGGGAVTGTTDGASLGAATVATPNDSLNAAETKEALALIKDEFGYSGKQFVEKLKAGADPKDLFMKAPENPLSKAEAQTAWLGAANGSPSVDITGTVEALANAAPANGSGASAPGTGRAPASVAEVGGGSGLRDALARALREHDDVDVSPEVKAALAAREAEERSNAAHSRATEELDLFDVVHRKYRERESNMRWGEPLHASAGAYE
jgi:hypothetical protein